MDLSQMDISLSEISFSTADLGIARRMTEMTGIQRPVNPQFLLEQQYV